MSVGVTVMAGVGGHGQMGVEGPHLRGGEARCVPGGPDEHLLAGKQVPRRVGLKNSWVTVSQLLWALPLTSHVMCGLERGGTLPLNWSAWQNLGWGLAHIGVTAEHSSAWCQGLG